MLGQPNNGNDKESRRAKQAEYARQLQQDNEAFDVQRNHNYPGGGGGGLGNIGINGRDEKAIKKAKQLEYNRQLQRDNPTSYMKNHSQQHGNNAYSQQSQPSGAYDILAGGNSVVANGDISDAKAMKRAKQAEYNRQLQEHEELKRRNDLAQMNNQHNQLKNYHQQSPTRKTQHTDSGDSLPDSGWEIGPLGQPVRKTLAVGNRNVQKAYVTKKHSPRKPQMGGPSQNGQQFDFDNNGLFNNNNNNDINSNNNNNYHGSTVRPNNMGWGQDPGINNAGGNFNQPNQSVQNQNSEGMFGGNVGEGFGNDKATNNKNQSDYAKEIEEQIRLTQVLDLRLVYHVTAK